MAQTLFPTWSAGSIYSTETWQNIYNELKRTIQQLLFADYPVVVGS
ncbi:MAG TPA: hypothetical protein VD794_05550 [Flavisolibacter sp.]|nr:hypothetical protein [Flavisolibacter sp.]